MRKKPNVVILAGGKGKRMRSDLPKPLHEVGGRPMLEWVIDKANALDPAKIIVVENPDRPMSLRLGKRGGVSFVVQDEPKGTGHALYITKEHLTGGPILMLYGDSPLINSDDLRSMIDEVESKKAFGGMLSAVFDEPPDFGRVKKDTAGFVIDIVQHKDASDEERRIKEVDAGPLYFSSPQVFDYMGAIEPSRVTGEIYSTKLINLAYQAGTPFISYPVSGELAVWGINTPEELEAARKFLDN